MKLFYKISSTCIFLGMHALPFFAQDHPMAAGGNGSGPGGSFSYSVGQIDYTYSSGSNGNSSQGVQHPYEIYAISIEEYQGIQIEVNIYPNPVNDVLTLTFSSLPATGSTCSLTDMHGKELRSLSIQNLSTSISMADIPCGEYFLGIYFNQQPIKSFKIIKNQ